MARWYMTKGDGNNQKTHQIVSDLLSTSRDGRKLDTGTGAHCRIRNHGPMYFWQWEEIVYNKWFEQRLRNARVPFTIIDQIPPELGSLLSV